MVGNLGEPFGKKIESKSERGKGEVFFELFKKDGETGELISTGKFCRAYREAQKDFYVEPCFSRAGYIEGDSANYVFQAVKDLKIIEKLHAATPQKKIPFENKFNKIEFEMYDLTAESVAEKKNNFK